MNLVLITKILQQQNPSFGYRLGIRRASPQRSGTRADVKFIIFCFSFLRTGAPDLFWRWIERERHIPRILRDTILRYRTTETFNCHSLAFLNLLRQYDFVSGMKDVVTLLLRTSNLGQFINASFAWSEQPEGHSFWAEMNAKVETMFRFFRNQPHPAESLFPDWSISQMRQTTASAVGILFERNIMDQFFSDYEDLERQRTQQELETFISSLGVAEGTDAQQSSVDEFLNSLPDFEGRSTPVHMGGGLYAMFFPNGITYSTNTYVPTSESEPTHR